MCMSEVAMRHGLLGVILLVACEGRILTPGPAPFVSDLGAGGLRRLTRFEYDNSLETLLGDTSRPGFATLPEDAVTPFDNDYATQQVSTALVEAAEQLAQDAAAAAMADPVRRAALLPCQPSGPGDADCLRKFITTFGRRALRRPLASDEVDRYLTLQSFAIEDQRFETGVEWVIRVILQHPEFLYHVEVGTPEGADPAVRRLTDFELASRVSFLLLGTTPDDELLDEAEVGHLSDVTARRAHAEQLLSDPRAADQLDRFHALWLGYAQLPHPADLTAAMRAESRALVTRVVLDEKRDYRDLFRFTQTRVGDLLAEQYGLPLPGMEAWVDYGSDGRAGILSHGSVLSAFGKFGDTSPTQRGKFVRTRLFCQPIPPPPPTVNVDNPPPATTSRCKIDRYAAHRAQATCNSCHEKMDPIGFGLERYDGAGGYRTVEPDAPECTISGDGEIVGIGTFNGPGELGGLVIASGLLEPCLVRQVYRFAYGRQDAPRDEGDIQRLATGFTANGARLDQLLLEVVASEPFSLTRQESP
jgi:hypothetical protein